ncbi:MAG: homoserine dehydrogenase [Candidatus Kapabacteria bacterium]|nr:homoserine dehydrogenase [Candidatus Kapabacteria bacterium]
MKSPLQIGLFGFGSVGQGLYDVLRRTPGLQSEIKRICVKDRTKQRPIDASAFTYSASDIIQDPDVDVIVELIDDADAAYEIVRASILNGKAVVTANKRMVATRLPELLELQRQTGRSLLYEASTCGSIPIIRNLEEYYDNDLLSGITGIVNGTTNFILTHLTSRGAQGGYASALREAAARGFAESDPTLDVEAYDAAFKTVILTAHAFGAIIDVNSVVRRGITAIAPFDVRVAASMGSVVKLLSRVVIRDGGVSAVAIPTFVPEGNALASISHEVNGVRLDAAFSEVQLMVGKGAGGGPTASAVLSDISALRYGYRYEYRKLKGSEVPTLNNQVDVVAYVRGSRSIIEAIPWKQRRIDVRGTDGDYIIGVLELSSLRESTAFADAEAFVALVLED